MGWGVDTIRDYEISRTQACESGYLKAICPPQGSGVGASRLVPIKRASGVGTELVGGHGASGLPSVKQPYRTLV